MADQRDWRVGHKGRDSMYYEERHLGAWRRIDIDGEMLTGRAHHVIYFDSVERWNRYPEWARDRRDEIIARMTSEFREPDYEYDGIDRGTPGATKPTMPPAPPPSGPVGASHRGAVPSSMPASQLRALMLAIAITLSIAAGMGWLVVTGLASGSSYMPSARPSQQRIVTRGLEPGFYWAAIGVYSTLGLMTLGLGLLGVRAMRQTRV